MKVLFISVTLAVVYLIRYKRIIRVTYDKDRDTFRSELLVAVSSVCALLVHERIHGAGYIHFLMEVRSVSFCELKKVPVSLMLSVSWNNCCMPTWCNLAMAVSSALLPELQQTLSREAISFTHQYAIEVPNEPIV